MTAVGLQLARHLAALRLSNQCKRQFTSSATLHAKNRIYNSIRHPNELHNLLLVSASTRTPLVTLWTAAWCPSCAIVRPLLRELIEIEGVGEAEGGVAYSEVELDSALIGDLGVTYMITSMPTLMAFSRQEAQLETKVTRLEQLKDRKFLADWIQTEAMRGGAGGAGGSLFGGWFSR